ncbi:dynamin-related protein 5A [Hordeum vulgare]|nr:dynamin-related protein 5A [Hordeum vulgare]
MTDSASASSPARRATPSPSACRAVTDSASTTTAAASAAADTKARFEAYNRLHAATVAFGEKLPIPEIVAIGGQSDGKSSLLEALLGFRFNVHEVEMGTRRALVLQMVHDPTALDSRCRFQEEDSKVYSHPMVQATAIADLIKQRTESHLRMIKAAVSPKPIVMRVEYAHCPNLTIIDTPGFVLKVGNGQSAASSGAPSPVLKRLVELYDDNWQLIEAESYRVLADAIFDEQDTTEDLTPQYDNVRCTPVTFEHAFESGEYGGMASIFSSSSYPEQVEVYEQSYGDGYVSLEQNFQSNWNAFSEDTSGITKSKRYKEAAPATLALLEQRCSDVSMDLSILDSKLQATSDVSQLRRSAMLHAASICTHLRALLDGAADPALEVWGKTTEEEQIHSGINSWPRTSVPVKPPNSSLKLYGCAAFERVANILLAHVGRGGSSGMTEAAAEIARAAARSWLAPLTETTCDRLAFVLQSLFDLAMERIRTDDSRCYDDLAAARA